MLGFILRPIRLFLILTRMKFFKGVIEKYRQSQWCNHRRSVGFYEAREELLGNGKIYFFEAETTTPTDTWTNPFKSTTNNNPMIADQYGVFPRIYLSDCYKIKLVTKNNAPIAIYETGCVEGFIE